MQRVSSGYTIIEVLIFLAISAMIFLSALAVIGGHGSQTQFAESLRDTHSKMQDWINDVSTGVPTGTVGQYYCFTAPPIVMIMKGTPPPGLDNPDCIFLGKAIQLTDSNYAADPSQASRIYAYPVFGQRLFGGSLTTNLVDANSTPAMGNPGGGVNAGTANDLWDEFDLPGDIKITKIESSPGVTSNTHMLGFYSSFNTEANTTNNGSTDLRSYTYPMSNEAPLSRNAFSCVNNKLPCSTSGPNNLNKIIICLSNGKNSGYITISSINGVGVSTQMDFGNCP